VNVEQWLDTPVTATLNTDPDSLMRTVLFSTSAEPNDDEPTRMARKLAGVFLVAHMEQSGAPLHAVEAVRDLYRELYPGIFPTKHH